jgi:hypothetical protein
MRFHPMAEYNPALEADNPRAWRNGCKDPRGTERLSDILNK